MMFSLLNKCKFWFKCVSWTNDQNTGEGCTVYRKCPSKKRPETIIFNEWLDFGRICVEHYLYSFNKHHAKTLTFDLFQVKLDAMKGTNILQVCLWNPKSKFHMKLHCCAYNCIWYVITLKFSTHCMETSSQIYFPPQQRWREYSNAAIRGWLSEWVRGWVRACVRHSFPCGHDSDYSFSPITFKLHV